MKLSIPAAVLVSLLSVAGAAAHAQTTVKDAWVRATVPKQMGTGMFARITSAQGGKLVGASSPVAGIVEVHEMAMQGDVMRMRAVAALDLPAGKAVELKPGGYHVMLMDLKQTLEVGKEIPLSLVIEGKDGKRETLELKVPVRSGAGGGGHKH